MNRNLERSATRAPARQLLILPLLAVLAACSAGEEPGPALAGGAITRWTDSTELFMEHPPLVVGAPDVFAIHFTDLTDFAPLRSGRVTLRFIPREGGAPLTVVQEMPRAPGIYGPRPEFTAPGLYDLLLLVESPQARDSIVIPGLRVYAKANEAPREEEGGDGGISFLKEQQWKTPGFRTAFAATGDLFASFDATGVIEAAAGRQARCSPSPGIPTSCPPARKAPGPRRRSRRRSATACSTAAAPPT